MFNVSIIVLFAKPNKTHQCTLSRAIMQPFRPVILIHFIEDNDYGHYQVIRCKRNNATMFDPESSFIQKFIELKAVKTNDVDIEMILLKSWLGNSAVTNRVV